MSTDLFLITPDNVGEKTGYLEYEYKMPGVACPFCGAWIGLRVLSMSLPDDAKALISKCSSKPVSPAEFLDLKQICEALIQEQPLDLEPGDRFQPAQWMTEVSPNDSAIQWLFDSEVIASSKFAGDLIAAKVSGIDLHKVISPTSRDFFHVSVTNHSAHRYQGEEGNSIAICEHCGHQSFSESIENRLRTNAHRKHRTIQLQYVLDADVFLSHLWFPGLVVKSNVVEILDSHFTCEITVERLRLV